MQTISLLLMIYSLKNVVLTLCILDQQVCGNPCQADQNQDEVVQDDDEDVDDGAGEDCEVTKIETR